MKKTIKKKIYSLNRVLMKNKEKNIFYALLYRGYSRLVKLWFYKIYRQKALILKGFKAVYIPIPKAANTSIRNLIENMGKLVQTKKYQKDKNFIFTFVRNPYDRIVSCYEDKRRKKDLLKGTNKFNNFFDKYDKIIEKEMTFKQFVKIVLKIPEHLSDHHIRSQHLFITDKKGNAIPDFIGNIESLEKDFKKACNYIGAKNTPEIKQKNKSKRKKDYREYYDEETRKLVEQRYKIDIEMFGYEF